MVISVPHSGQMRIAGGTGFGTSTRSRCAAGAARPGCRPLRLLLSLAAGFAASATGAAPGAYSLSESWRSNRVSTSECGRLRRRWASFFVSSPLTSQTLVTNASTALTSSRNRRSWTIRSRNARTSARSGAYGEVIRSGLLIHHQTGGATDEFLSSTDFFVGSHRGRRRASASSMPSRTSASSAQSMVSARNRPSAENFGR